MIVTPFQSTTIFIWFVLGLCCFWEIMATIFPERIAPISATMGRAFFNFPTLLPIILTAFVWMLWHWWQQRYNPR